MNKAATALLIVGLLQMTGDLFDLPLIKGLGAATAASPAPKVFSAVRGLETYSTRFYLEWVDVSGEEHSLELTPEVYARIKGPYNRRNIYGAALAYAPILSTDPRSRQMFDAVSMYALCGDARLLAELGVEPGSVSGGVRVRLEPLPGTDLGSLPHVLEVSCR
jgi:hypothetical protein